MCNRASSATAPTERRCPEDADVAPHARSGRCSRREAAARGRRPSLPAHLLCRGSSSCRSALRGRERREAFAAAHVHPQQRPGRTVRAAPRSRERSVKRSAHALRGREQLREAGASRRVDAAFKGIPAPPGVRRCKHGGAVRVVAAAAAASLAQHARIHLRHQAAHLYVATSALDIARAAPAHAPGGRKARRAALRRRAARATTPTRATPRGSAAAGRRTVAGRPRTRRAAPLRRRLRQGRRGPASLAGAAALRHAPLQPARSMRTETPGCPTARAGQDTLRRCSAPATAQVSSCAFCASFAAEQPAAASRETHIGGERGRHWHRATSSLARISPSAVLARTFLRYST